MMHSPDQNDFPVNEYLEVLKGITVYRSTYKWIAVVVVNHPQSGPQLKLYEWIWKANHWSTHAKIILNDHQYNNINFEGIEQTRKDLWDEFT